MVEGIAQAGQARIKDNKLVVLRDWPSEADRIKGAFAIVRDLAEKVAGQLAQRRAQLDARRSEAGIPARTSLTDSGDLLRRIRTFFGL